MDRDRVPSEIQSILTGHRDFGPLGGWQAEPEVRLRFDDFQGEPRNTDLLVCPQHGQFIIGIEAKADEPFADIVAETFTAALERKLENTNSNGIRRVEQLAGALFVKRDGELDARL